jgi:hypothetical protein
LTAGGVVLQGISEIQEVLVEMKKEEFDPSRSRLGMASRKSFKKRFVVIRSAQHSVCNCLSMRTFSILYQIPSLQS